MRILLAGASGTIGTALIRQLEKNHEVTRLVRRAPREPREIRWNPAAGELDVSAVENADAVINLSGAGIAGGLWTRSYKETLYSSRIMPTRTLVQAMRAAHHPPEVFISQSASGYYGDRGDDVLTEAAASGQTLLADICRRWEAEALGAPDSVRVVLPRTGIVMAQGGGALPNLLVPIRLFAGTSLGPGRQWWPWISLNDEVRALEFLLTAPLSGAVNLSAPTPATLDTITLALGKAFSRPVWFRVPASLLKAVIGQLGYELLLVSTRMEPRKLTAAGFTFDEPTPESLASWVRRLTHS
ncbi:TIGR01777 family oxidoreductase [Arthrobacter agilis]|uniref:TIGR01777 family oxidoreductase n=1 Tax=Arthrobacter agilis TaxID=37921 RepID=UPI0023655E5D|nr:TIGR01777 family oxidoreductase [Arthrobacter agilis]WDF34579.1 TIGR01777 family oxidoreductase [Arthrobacter agilis]